MPSEPAMLTQLQFAALAIYAEHPRHPYEVFQEMLKRREDRLVKVRPGTLYHAVNRLAELGLLEAAGTGREGNRPERTTYAITEAGREAVTAHVAQAVARRAEEFPEFPLALAELHSLEPSAAADLLALRAAALRSELDSLDHAEPHLRGSDLPEVLWIEHTWLSTMVRSDLAWTEALVRRLRSGGLSWSRESLEEFERTRRQVALTPCAAPTRPGASSAATVPPSAVPPATLPPSAVPPSAVPPAAPPPATLPPSALPQAATHRHTLKEDSTP